MKKLILFLFLIINSCLGLKNELDKKKANEEVIEIVPIKLEEGKIYNIAHSAKLEDIYREEALKIVDEIFEDDLRDYQILKKPKDDLVNYLKNSYKNEVPDFLQKELAKVNNLQEIKELMIKKYFNKLLLERPHAFTLKDEKLHIYISPSIYLAPIWSDGLQLSVKWEIEKIKENIENGIYYINNHPFQIIEAKNLEKIDKKIMELQNKNKTPEDKIENQI